MAKSKDVDTTEVKSTKQVLKKGEAEVTGRATDEDGPITRKVETTEAVFKSVDDESENDSDRNAHRAVFEEGEPRAADEDAS